MVPNHSQRADFEKMLTAAIAGEIAVATDTAMRAGYRLVRFTHPIDAVALYQADDAGVHPTVVIATKPTLELIIQAPHAGFEQDTVPEAAEIFIRGPARVLIVSGAHRCASPIPSQCQDGRGTIVCGTNASGGPKPYSASDVAHSPDSLFATATRVLSMRWTKAMVVQVHGMKPMTLTRMLGPSCQMERASSGRQILR